MRAWLLLLIAGILETGWAVGLKYTEGFTRFWPSVWTLLALAGSMVLLGIAVRDLPIGTAYPVWVGIGAVGAALFGIVVLGESVTPWRILFLTLLVVSIIGLKWSAGPPRIEQISMGPAPLPQTPRHTRTMPDERSPRTIRR